MTRKGEFFYEPIELYYGRKIIDRDVCKENLLLFKKILDLNNVQFGLMFGTLLGAVRENNFIKHDEDVDVFVVTELQDEMLETLFIFEDYGFKVARYSEHLLSLMRNNDYIDVYFFKEISSNRCCMNYAYPSNYFIELIEYNFLGTKFYVSENYLSFLEQIYGEDWNIPKENEHAKENVVKKRNENYIFSQYFNKFFTQISKLEKKTISFVIYGNGTIGKTIYSLLPENVVGVVDKTSVLISKDIQKGEVYHPENLSNMHYDKIIISVLGREEEILKYLVEDLKIEQEKIVILEL